MKVPFFDTFTFPAITQIRIVANDYHQSPVVVEDAFVVDFLGVRAFPGPSAATAAPCGVDTGNLRLLLEIVNTMKDVVFQRQLLWFTIWKTLV